MHVDRHYDLQDFFVISKHSLFFFVKFFVHFAWSGY